MTPNQKQIEALLIRNQRILDANVEDKDIPMPEEFEKLCSNNSQALVLLKQCPTDCTDKPESQEPAKRQNNQALAIFHKYAQDHYWSSLEKDKDIILKHIGSLLEMAYNELVISPRLEPVETGDFVEETKRSYLTHTEFMLAYPRAYKCLFQACKRLEASVSGDSIKYCVTHKVLYIKTMPCPLCLQAKLASSEKENKQLKGEKPIPFAWWKDCPKLAQKTMERIIETNEQLKKDLAEAKK